MKMGEAGLIDLFYDRAAMYFAKDLHDSDDFKAFVDIRDLRTDFTILIGSWSFAIIVLLIEIVIYIIRKYSTKMLNIFMF